jgi:hypothetical protein
MQSSYLHIYYIESVHCFDGSVTVKVMFKALEYFPA